MNLSNVVRFTFLPGVEKSVLHKRERRNFLCNLLCFRYLLFLFHKMSSQKKLVILGGGAAGLLIAMKLADAPIDITLVDNKVPLNGIFMCLSVY